MHKLTSAIRSWADECFKNMKLPEGVERRHLLTMALAMIVAYRLPLPSGQVTRPKEWYINNVLSICEEAIGKINEYTVVDISTCLEMVCTIWTMRYRMVHEPMSNEAIKCCSYCMGGANIAPVYADAATCLMADREGNLQRVILEAQQYAGELVPQADQDAGAEYA